MLVTFDPCKDTINCLKHGVSLVEATRLDWEHALTWLDTRRDYGEEREIALAAIGNTLFYAVFVERHGGMRIISMRRATNKEIKRYVQTY